MRFLFIICFLSPVTLIAQYSSGLRSIEWLPVRTEVFDGQTIHYLSFKNADYPDLNTLIPNYHELIKTGNNLESEVQLEETSYETILNEDIKDIRFLDKIPDRITVSSQIVYIRKEPYLQINLIPIRRNPLNNNLERLVQFSLRIIPKNKVV